MNDHTHLSQPPDVEVDGLRREGLINPPDGPGSQPHDGSGRVQLSFSPSGREVRVPTGVTVFDAASWNGIAIDSTCGGHGTCKKCKVQVLDGSTPVHRLDARSFTAAQLADGWRLACLAQATQDLAVEVPPLTTRPKAATLGVGRQVILRPAVQKRYVELVEPTLQDQRTDLQRLTDAIDDLELTPDLHALRRLPTVLREADFKVTAVIVDEALVDVEAGDTTERRYAVAFDLGTTTVVATLIDTATGTPAAVASMLNKQQPFGGDVITRISATMMDPLAADRLRDLAQDTLRELTGDVLTEAGVEPNDVYEVALAGNATMTALVLGIDPEPLGVAPFVMSSRIMPTLLASDLGLELHPRARAVVFPALGAYVGGDIVSGMLATGMDRDKRTRLFIDVGTNCEIVLSDGDTIVSTAAPAGPAFEGGAIRCGMRAADGAVEVIRIDDDGVHLQVIGDTEPVGICGSGLVDAVSELVRAGLLDSSGRFVPEEKALEIAPHVADRLTSIGQERVFVLHRPEPDSPARRDRLPLPARRPRAAVRQGRDRHRLDAAARAARPGAVRRAAGAAGRVVRQLPLPRGRRPDRPGAEDPGAAHRLGRQRRRRGCQDEPAERPRTRRRPRPAGGGGLCRALRPHRLQRPVHRPPRLPRLNR